MFAEIDIAVVSSPLFFSIKTGVCLRSSRPITGLLSSENGENVVAAIAGPVSFGFWEVATWLVQTAATGCNGAENGGFEV